MNRLACFLVVLLTVGCATAAAEEHRFRDLSEVNLTDLVEELQRMSRDDDRVLLVWWIPEPYWRVSLGEQSAQNEAILDVLRPYVAVAVVDGNIGPLGGVTYRPRAETEQMLRIVGANETRYAPLPASELPADLTNLVGMLRPIFANMLGPMGQNLSFYFFPASDSDGTRVVDARRSGEFRVVMGEERFHWRLPLGTLLQPKACPVDGEVLSGAWSYCPWHGEELEWR